MWAQVCVYQGAHAWASMGAHLSMDAHACYTRGIIGDGQQENRNYWKYTYVYMPFVLYCIHKCKMPLWKYTIYKR